MRYEVVREIFNQCSGNQMRDVDFREVVADDIESIVAPYRTGANIEEEKHVEEDGTVVYELVVDGLRQRFSISEA